MKFWLAPRSFIYGPDLVIPEELPWGFAKMASEWQDLPKGTSHASMLNKLGIETGNVEETASLVSFSLTEMTRIQKVAFYSLYRRRT